jgi:predicted phosphoribosyltransferase
MESQTDSKLRILSRSDEPFLNRTIAGELLAYELSDYRSQKPVVVGIPPGGVIIAREIAEELHAQLDIVLAHKLRTPGDSELAMGSVSERGDLFLNQDIMRGAYISDRDIEQEKTAQITEIERRVKLFRIIRPRIPLQGRTVIITDDGIATGATTQAAIKAVQAEKPKKLILAVPFGSEDILRELAVEVDEVVCLKSPPGLTAIGQIYINFEAVTDEEVIEILKNYRIKEDSR